MIMDRNISSPIDDHQELHMHDSTSQQRPGVVDVIGGHGPWQLRLWMVFLAASFAFSTLLFSVNFLPMQNLCLNTSESLYTHLSEFSIATLSPNTSGGNTVAGLCNSTSCGAQSTRIRNPDYSYSLNQCRSYREQAYARCIFPLGFNLSGFLVYFLSNKFGYRPVSLVSCFFLVISALAASWANSYEVFLVLRFLIATTTANIYLIAAFSLMEYVHNTYKALYFMTGHIGWGVAQFFLPFSAWLTGDWTYFHIVLSAVCLVLSVFIWCSPESLSSYPIKSSSNHVRKVLKYAAFHNGYPTTDVDLFASSFHLRKEKKTDTSLPETRKEKIIMSLFYCLLFLSSFMTSFLYFASRWHSAWFRIDPGTISFAFLGSTEIASCVILLFLTCLINIKYLWTLMSAMSSLLLITSYAKTSSSYRSSSILYTGVVFFSSGAWTLVLLGTFAKRVASTVSRLTIALLGLALCLGALAASSVKLRADNQVPLLVWGVLHLVCSIFTAILPNDYFGNMS